MKSRSILIFLLVLTAVSSGLEGVSLASELPQPLWVDLSTSLLVAVAIVGWYHVNSKEKGFRRTAFWTVGVVLLPVAVIPLYIFRSNPPATRWKALGKFAGYLCLSFLVAILSMAIVDLAVGPVEPGDSTGRGTSLGF